MNRNGFSIEDFLYTMFAFVSIGNADPNICKLYHDETRKRIHCTRL